MWCDGSTEAPSASDRAAEATGAALTVDGGVREAFPR